MMKNMVGNHKEKDLAYSLILARFFISSMLRRMFTPDDYADLKDECPAAFKEAEEAIHCTMVYEQLLWRIKSGE